MVLRKEELERCNGCGFCQAACPVYRVTRHEGSTARGHHVHLKALLEGSLEPEQAVVSHFSECLTCRACTVHCPPQIQTDHIVVEARHRLLAFHQSRLEHFALHHLLADPARLRRWVRLLRFGRKAQPAAFLSLLHRLHLLPSGLLRASEMMHRPAGGFLYERVKRLNLTPTVASEKVAYFMSCGMDFLCPDAGEASLAVLRKLGCEVLLPDNVCCGLPAYASGDLEAASRLARQNLGVFSEISDLIITDCASCSSFLKEYPRLLGEEAVDFSRRVRDFSEFVAAHWPPSSLSAVLPSTVTYHEPCHLSRYQNLRSQPRQLLNSIDGAEYRELPEADWCCGGAGSYGLRHPELSLKILERKMTNLRGTGAEILATACPGCLVQLTYGVRRWKLPVRVVHISQILAESLF